MRMAVCDRDGRQWEWRESGRELLISLSFTNQLSACHHLQPNHFPWQLIAFYYMHHTYNPGESFHTHTHTAYQRKMSVDVWQLCSTQDHSTMLSFCQRKKERKRLIPHAAWGGRESGEGQQWNSLIPAICQSKLLLFFNHTEHKQTQSCANESKWDVTVLLVLIY